MALKARKQSTVNSDKHTVSTVLTKDAYEEFTAYLKEQGEKNNCVISVSDAVRYAIEELVTNTDLEITVE
jgi:hypothetical protein